MRLQLAFPYGRYHAVRCLGIFAIVSVVLYVYLWDFVIPPGALHSPWRTPPPPPSLTPPEEWNRRANAVKDAFVHAYRGYVLHASPHDELKPLSNQSADRYVLIRDSTSCLLISNSFNGWGVTLYDALDTMVLMGLETEFAEALKVIEHADFKLERVGTAGHYSYLYFLLCPPFFSLKRGSDMLHPKYMHHSLRQLSATFCAFFLPTHSHTNPFSC